MCRGVNRYTGLHSTPDIFAILQCFTDFEETDFVIKRIHLRVYECLNESRDTVAG